MELVSHGRAALRWIVVLALALSVSRCGQDTRSAFTEWLDGGWTAGPFVEPGTRVAQTTPTQADLRALWSDADKPVGVDSPAEVTAGAPAALLEACPDREIVINDVTAGRTPDAWLLCSRRLSATCTSFVVVGLERTASGSWIVACAFMAGIT